MIPLLRIEFIVLLYFVVHSLDVGVGYAVIDDFNVVLGKILLNVVG
jgi:hypothetical protein